MSSKDLSRYFNKHASGTPRLADSPNSSLGIVVTIPCHNEPDLIASLQSIAECDEPRCGVEVIVMLNASAKSTNEQFAQNDLTESQFLHWKESYSGPFEFRVICDNDLPVKKAGVGLAGKIAMDEAAYRLEQVGNSDGVIVCYDADSTCSKNFLLEIERHFRSHPNSPGCSIAFKHPLSGNKFHETIYRGIVQYELHLRYFIEAQRWAGIPYAFHTVGSSMAVRASSYQRVGGMNRRQAGEDFYFLHKVIALGHFTELNSACVIPSPRPSDRVPFGTGRAINGFLKSGEDLTSYNPKCFVDVKGFISLVDRLYSSGNQIDMPESVVKYFGENKLEDSLREIRSNVASREAFRKRFYRWFDAFQLFKFMHYCRDTTYPNVALVEACNWLFDEIGIDQKSDHLGCLLTLRKIQLENKDG